MQISFPILVVASLMADGFFYYWPGSIMNLTRLIQISNEFGIDFATAAYIQGPVFGQGQAESEISKYSCPGHRK